MSPQLVFCYGLGLLILFAWYLFTDSDRAKRNLGTALTVLLAALCLEAVYPPSKTIGLGLDLRGGTSFLIQLVAEPVEVTDPAGNKTMEKRAITRSMVDQAVEVIRKRVDNLGTGESVITPAGEDRILVQIPGLELEKLKSTREQLQKVAKLEFRKVHPNSAGILAGTVPPDPGFTSLPHVELKSKTGTDKDKPVEEDQIIVRKKVDLEGKHVSRAGAGFDAKGWVVNIVFDGEGADIFGKLTEEVYNDRSALAIVLDGKVISAPGVRNGPIYGGRCEISGDFDETTARNLASALENPLQTPVTILEERSASASLGADSIKSGIKAGLIGFALVMVLMLAYYHFAGLISDLALLLNIVFLFGALAMFGVVLTLPGIAGLILTLGMAVDANVLIYERLREELADGKSFPASVRTAYEKAFSAIFDSNVTTLITAMILFWRASGPVKGFAVTLMVGIIGSMFCALVVTRTVYAWMLMGGRLKKLGMLSLIKNPNYNFLSHRRAAIIASLLLIAGLGVVFGFRGAKNFGIDFKGGDRIVLEATKTKAPLAEVRAALAKLDVGEVLVQTEQTPQKEFLTVGSNAGKGQEIEDSLLATFPSAGFVETQFEKVGPKVGGELARSSLVALALGLLGILLYVTVRFEFSFALGALVALLHDVLITIGAFALFGRELSLVAVGAVLTIAGYSINDTIVVFDRIREGIKGGRRGSVLEIMNASINETLSRTILTSGTTLLPALSLFLLGGPVLSDFGFAILVGVIVGTYSSIFIAAPIVLWWTARSGTDLREELKRAERQTEATA
ncbi:MAG: protein translocase subunit SecD [Chthoniobacteraceae bacterium]